MRIAVINGSPKANQSITLHHIHYLAKRVPAHPIEIINVSNRIATIEKDKRLFDEITEKMAAADAVLWSFPVYYCLVPSQLKRFLELLFERCAPGIFSGKYTTSFTTSINFFDHAAHNYMQGVCEELGFLYVKSYSAHMEDFFSPDRRDSMLSFYKWFLKMVEQKVPVNRKYSVPRHDTVVYDPGALKRKEKTLHHKVLLLTDEQATDTNLAKMVEVFKNSSAMNIDTWNLHNIDMKNGCLGCCRCGYENKCIQKDGYASFFNDHLKRADIIIFAGSVKDHYLSSTWKKFLDRSFFNGHIPALEGKRLGFILSGPLSRIQNLREVLEAYAEIWHMKSCGFVTDEHGTSEEITRQLHAFNQEIELACEQDLEFGGNYYQVAGKKLFRDFIYETSAVFRADHKFYRRTGVYKDFPQRKYKKRYQNAVFKAFLAIRPIRKKIHAAFVPGMLAPYKKALGKLDG